MNDDRSFDDRGPRPRGEEPRNEQRMHLWRRAIAMATLTSLLILGVGVAAVIGQRPWLFASLGPTAYLLVYAPRAPQSSFMRSLAGQFIGIAAGFSSLALFVGVETLPLIAVDRVLAATVATGLAVFVQLITGMYHVPALSTTLMIALGTVPFTVRAAGDIFIGVSILVILDEAMRNVAKRLEEKGFEKKLPPLSP